MYKYLSVNSMKTTDATKAAHTTNVYRYKLWPSKLVAYLRIKGILSLGGTVSPKNSASSAILHKTLRTMSPRYIPEIIFSKICQQETEVRWMLIQPYT